MIEQAIHITTPISRDDLDAVITGLEIACGGIRIVITEAFDLIVKDERQASALTALFSSNGKGQEAIVRPTKKKQENASKEPAKAIGMRSYRFGATGEFISGQAINKRLMGHAIPEGTIFKNAKGERFSIMSNIKNPDGPFLLEKQS